VGWGWDLRLGLRECSIELPNRAPFVTRPHQPEHPCRHHTIRTNFAAGATTAFSTSRAAATPSASGCRRAASPRSSRPSGAWVCLTDRRPLRFAAACSSPHLCSHPAVGATAKTHPPLTLRPSPLTLTNPNPKHPTPPLQKNKPQQVWCHPRKRDGQAGDPPGALRICRPDGEHARLLPHLLHRQRAHPVCGPPPAQRGAAVLRRVRGAAAGVEAVAGAGDVPLYQVRGWVGPLVGYFWVVFVVLYLQLMQFPLKPSHPPPKIPLPCPPHHTHTTHTHLAAGTPPRWPARRWG